MVNTGPMTPPEVVARRKLKMWTPDRAGRLLFRPRGLAGPAYVVETVEQLQRVERVERIKYTLMAVIGGAGVWIALQSRDTDEASVLGSLLVVVALVVCLVAYSLVGGARAVRDTAMRRKG